MCVMEEPSSHLCSPASSCIISLRFPARREEQTYGSRKVRVKLIDNYEFMCFSADEEFDELCFEFGLELDEIVSNLNR